MRDNGHEPSGRQRYPEQVTMTAVLAKAPVMEGVPSLEVRWILPGQLDAAVARWFGRSHPEIESREDIYVLEPDVGELSVKVRGGGALEVKAYRGSPGILEVPGHARGRMELWRKWSFPFSPFSSSTALPAGWTPVTKRRRISRFSLASGQIAEGAGGLAEEASCAVELTEVRMGGQVWWSLGFETTGLTDLLPGELEATARLMFAQAPPDGVRLGAEQSASYAEWLHRRLRADGHAPA
jgi:hypothetical protein